MWPKAHLYFWLEEMWNQEKGLKKSCWHGYKKFKQCVYILENENQCYLSIVDESWLWHRRLGHLNFDNIVKISKKKVVRDFPKILKPLNTVCKHCQLGKQTRTSSKTKEHMTSHPLEIVHTYLCGPWQVWL